MWSYTAPDRRPQPVPSTPLEGEDQIVRQHGGRRPTLRLVSSPDVVARGRATTATRTDNEESS
jgi:hypothetical protein